jgi:hypothetical protein
MLFPSWFDIGLDIAELSLPMVVLVGLVIYLRLRSMRVVDVCVQGTLSPKSAVASDCPVRRGSRTARKERGGSGRLFLLRRCVNTQK